MGKTGLLLCRAIHGLPGKGQQIADPHLDGSSLVIVENDLDLGAIFKKHLSAIFERLGVANRSEAVALALRKQMLKT